MLGTQKHDLASNVSNKENEGRNLAWCVCLLQIYSVSMPPTLFGRRFQSFNISVRLIRADYEAVQLMAAFGVIMMTSG